MRDRTKTLVVFGSHRGLPPYDCFFCGYIVEIDRLFVVHHANCDESDDSPDNLVPSHRGCHQRWHNQNRIVSDETKQRIKKARLGTHFSDEHKKNISLANQGKHSKLTADQVREIREARSGGQSAIFLGRKYGVDRRTIDRIVKRKTWAHV